MKKIPLSIVRFMDCEMQMQELGEMNLHRSAICAGGVEGVDTCEVLILNC